jgi:hypothetical protein
MKQAVATRKSTIERYTEFAKVWNAARSAEEVGRRYQKTSTWAREYAMNARKAGVSCKKMRVDDSLEKSIQIEKFVEEWNAAASAHDIAQRYGVTTGYLRVHVKQLRERGYQLRRFDGTEQRTQDGSAMPSRYVCWAPGSPEKIEELRRRAEAGEYLWHPLDATNGQSINPHWQTGPHAH